jgi:hypothetical protein
VGIQKQRNPPALLNLLYLLFNRGEIRAKIFSLDNPTSSSYEQCSTLNKKA